MNRIDQPNEQSLLVDSDNSVQFSFQNKPITSIQTEVILSSRPNCDVGLLVIDSKEMI